MPRRHGIIHVCLREPKQLLSSVPGPLDGTNPSSLCSTIQHMLATSKTSSEFDSDESKRLMDSWKPLKEKC